MPPPVSGADVFACVQQSGLLPPADLAAFRAGLPAGAADWTPPDVLERLTTAGLLTPFQADRISAGKYKGFVLGGYIVLDCIGSGGMGQVYLAEHAAMRRLVALKVLPHSIAGDPVSQERFLREARAAGQLDHPHIMKVFDYSRAGRLWYLVMEYIAGVNLTDLLKRTGPVPVGAAADYARQVCLGLQHAHEKGLVHRDIKPSNLLLDRHGTVRILDLGLARSDEDADSRLTPKSGATILGTADYVAPEQALNSFGVDIRADLYGLAATIYHIVAGRPLFPDGRAAQKLMWQQWKEPERLDRVRANVASGFADIIHKALAKKPADRFTTPAEMAAALSPFALGPAAPPADLIPAPPPRATARGLRPVGMQTAADLFLMPDETVSRATPTSDTPSVTPPRPRRSLVPITPPPLLAITPLSPSEPVPQLDPLPPLLTASAVQPALSAPVLNRQTPVIVGLSVALLGTLAALVWALLAR